MKGKLIKWATVEKIGSGSFGSVFKAINMRTGKLFAVKSIALTNASI